MKYGYMIGLRRNGDKISFVASKEKVTLEDFLVNENIQNTQDIHIFSDIADEQYRKNFISDLLIEINKNWSKYKSKSLLAIIYEQQKEETLGTQEEENFEEVKSEVAVKQRTKLHKIKPTTIGNTSGVLENKDVLNFILGGRSYFTLVNEDTSNRITYKVNFPRRQRDEKNPVYFVRTADIGGYKYLGMMVKENNVWLFKETKKTDLRIATMKQKFQVFQWYLKNLQQQSLPESIKFYHEGRCCRCGRKLTVPESIKTGIGPECKKRINNF